MVKRLVDILLTLAGGLLLAPVLIFVALAVRINLGSPVLFCQSRPGLHGKPFLIYKFRSMNDKRDSNGKLLPDEQRLTFFGKMLRSTSLDELPELWNVIKGDMSLVGPRPLLMEYLELYSPEQFKRHDIRPGITGWAQINGRNALTWEEKFKQDIWYVENQSLWLDLKILYLTVIKVLRRDDISEDGMATMSKFTGNNND